MNNKKVVIIISSLCLIAVIYALVIYKDYTSFYDLKQKCLEKISANHEDLVGAIFLKDGISVEALESFKSVVLSTNGVKRVVFLTPVEAMAEYRESHKNNPRQNDLPLSSFRSKINVYADSEVDRRELGNLLKENMTKAKLNYDDIGMFGISSILVGDKISKLEFKPGLSRSDNLKIIKAYELCYKGSNVDY